MRSRFAWIVVALVVGLFSLGSLVSDDTPLEPWHSENLTEEFTIRRADEVRAFDDYGALEDRLFAQLDAKVYGPTATGPENALVRYSNGGAADPERRTPNWNRSFELPADAPLGGAPRLHGMTDSPYSRVWEGLLGCRFALSSILISTTLSPPMRRPGLQADPGRGEAGRCSGQIQSDGGFAPNFGVQVDRRRDRLDRSCG